MRIALLIIIQSNMITKHILSSHCVSKLLRSSLSCSDCYVFLVYRLTHFIANGAADFVVDISNGASELVVNLLHLDPLIYELSSSKKILNIVKKFEVNSPHHGTRPYIRVDFPNDKKHSFFELHQDFPINNHSLNSLVVWIPLQNTGIKEGCLRVSKKSHKGRKIYKTDKNLIIKKKILLS